MITRRTLLQTLTASTFFVMAGGSRKAFAAVQSTQDPAAFPHGVASGDPTEESVVLWTRMLPLGMEARAAGVLQLSRKADFSEVIAERDISASAQSDWTVRVVAGGLEPDRSYFYRFVRSDGAASMTGRTATAPRAGTDRDVRFAFASCQNRQTGWYHAYRHLLEQDAANGRDSGIEFVLFLGDFIYEELFQGVQRDMAFPGPSDRPAHAVSLDDYRFLYRSYLSDPYLQQARARWPFLTIWDDHEFSNNSWQSVSTYTPENAPTQTRKVAANQAWFEFIPAQLSGLKGDQIAHDFKPARVTDAPLSADEGLADNLKAIESLRIPRRLQWGKRVDLFLTDSRSYRSKHPVPVEEAMKFSFHPHAFQPVAEVAAWDAGREASPSKADRPVGTMWGDRQKAWLKRGLKASDAVWKVCAVSVPMTELTIDFGIPDKKLTPVETALNIDAFDGYPAERLEFLSFLRDEGVSNVVSLTGDHHMHFSSVLGEGMACGPAAVEFAVAGISSTNYFRVFDLYVGRIFPDGPIPGLFSNPGPDGTPQAWLNTTVLYGHRQTLDWLKDGGAPSERALAEAPRRLPGLRYLDSDSYGIALATARRERFDVEYLVFDQDTMVQDYAEEIAPPARRAALSTRSGARPDLSPVEYEGGAPFPFLPDSSSRDG